jgi:GAF domain-containing protein
MRSSLALASEQDPQVLMATLLRVLCQYTRADYAAIALADSEDPSTFRLVASGAYERIAPRDLSLAADEAHKHCPANLMIKVALTGKVSFVRLDLHCTLTRIADYKSWIDVHCQLGRLVR